MDWQTLPISEYLGDLPKGAAFAIALILTFLGYRKGVNSEQPPKKEVEIAGAIVDNSAIFKLATAIEAQNAILAKSHENARTFMDNARLIVEAFNRHSDEVRKLTEEIRDSVTALLRSQR